VEYSGLFSTVEERALCRGCVPPRWERYSALFVRLDAQYLFEEQAHSRVEISLAIDRERWQLTFDAPAYVLAQKP
jgi:hypothetical protein